MVVVEMVSERVGTLGVMSVRINLLWASYNVLATR